MNETTIGTSGRRLSDQAYIRLRDALVTLEFEPMQPLNERILSAQLGMGLAPIREALRRLEHERLVTIYPRRGIFAAEIVITDQQAIKEVRYELEGLAAALAAERATKEESDALIQIADRLVLETTSHGKITGDAEFRMLVYNMARNSFLQPILETHLNLARRLWYFCRRQKSRTAIGPIDLRPVAEAIAAGDALEARQLLSSAVAEHSDMLREMLS
ncbi:GntR family transcriptional regulator [Aquibaculum sediminis]|uniref:GntR family transcriptional regulator n=1 Tax=Aquibaculum sediminis TaxID=3231907 RepID=UPI003452D3B7